MTLEKEPAVLSPDAHCFMKNVRSAILSYSTYCCMTNHLRLSNKDHFITSSRQESGKGTTEVSRLCSTVSGTSTGKTQTLGRFGSKAWSLCFFMAQRLGSRSKCPKTHVPVMAVWEDQVSARHKNKCKTEQPHQNNHFKSPENNQR